MKSIEEHRQQIDTIDNQIVALLQQRFIASSAIGQLKQQAGTTVRHKKREQAIIARLSDGQELLLIKLIKKIYPLIFKASRQQQSATRHSLQFNTNSQKTL